MAELLFGDVSPSGKLPVTFYETLEELPDFTDYSMQGRTYRYMTHKAQYPFGYGLTYGDVYVKAAEILKDKKVAVDGKCESDGEGKTCGPDSICLNLTVENAGSVSTEDVIQIYVKCLDSKLAPPNPSLCAFQRVRVESGETKTVTVGIPRQAFTIVDEAGCRRVDGREFVFYAGCSQPDEKSRELTGHMPVEVRYEL